ncbi:hypothetical protein [Amycolatopsis sp. cmx-4-83]|uniref:hypothetical protein n=1 Tax=Amycolatopsis sp. cmx-4-83 TaxID=2790940 RepID=UPI00397A6E09
MSNELRGRRTARKQGRKRDKCDVREPAPRSTLGLAISNGGSTTRLVVVLVVLVSLIGAVVWLLEVDVVVGPVQITRRAALVGRPFDADSSSPSESR